MTERACKAVLISREMGSGGSYIGHLVAQNPGFRYVDRVIVHEAARCLGEDEERGRNWKSNHSLRWAPRPLNGSFISSGSPSPLIAP